MKEDKSGGQAAFGVEVTINGERASIPAGLTLAGLLAHLGIEQDKVAVELNRELVRRSAWESTPIDAGSQLEVVHFVGGG